MILYEIFIEKLRLEDFLISIRLLNNKCHGLSPSVGHHSLLFDQGSQTMRDYITIYPIGMPSDGILYR